MINKILILFLILGFNTQIFADQHEKKELDEELPAVNPFLGGASSSAGQNNTNTESSQNGSLLNNLKLVGIIKGEVKNIAIFSSPDGRSVRYSEDTIVNPNLMILDIFSDHIYFKSNKQEYSIDLNNNITKSEG